MGKDEAKRTTSTTTANHDKIDAWFKEFFHGSIISGNTEIYNFCFSAKEELKKRIN